MKRNSSAMQMLGMRWTLEDFSKRGWCSRVNCPEFYLTPECILEMSISANQNFAFLFLCNKSDTNVTIEETTALFDNNNKKLHEGNARTLTLEKGVTHVIGRVTEVNFRNLICDVLVIELWICIKEIAAKKLNRSLYDIDTERKLKEDLKAMFETPINPDMSLKVGKERIPAHWSILCSRSPYFKRMFDSGMKECVENSINITDSSIGTVKRLIQFLYTADFTVDYDLKELFDLYYAADKYEVLDLRHLCACEIMNNITVDNVCLILLIAHHHSDKDLKSATMDFIQSHADAVFQTQGWEKFKASEPLAAEFCSFFCRKEC